MSATHFFRRIPFGPILFTLGACSSGTSPDVNASMLTDEPAYLARSVSITHDYSFVIIATYQNQSADTVFLQRCSPSATSPQYGVISATSPAAEVAFDPAWACVGHDKQIPVAPGGARVDTLTLYGPVARNGATGKPLGTLEGVFRLIYLAQHCRGDGACRLPQSAARSNAFRVTLSG